MFLQGDLAGAEARLAESARLFRNNDINNQLHLAELSMRKGDADTAEEHYLNVITLAYGPADTTPQRMKAQMALFTMRSKTGESFDESKTWLARTLERKREERRKALVGNMQGRRVPAVVLKDLQGNNVDLRAERGNVVLLNFFSAW